MLAAQVVVAMFALMFAATSAYNWWAAHDHPTGNQEGYMDFALITGVIAMILLTIGWLISL